MKHAKKMTLVDSNFVIDPRNIKKHYSSLDQGVADVLNRQDIDHYGKLVFYRIALNKFLINTKSLEFDLDKPLKVTIDTSKAEKKPVSATNQNVGKHPQVKEEATASTLTAIPSLSKPAVETSRSIKSTNCRKKKGQSSTKKDQFLYHRHFHANAKNKDPVDIPLKMETYFNVRSPGSYGCVQALYKLMKGKKTKKEIVEWLAKQDA